MTQRIARNRALRGVAALLLSLAASACSSARDSSVANAVSPEAGTNTDALATSVGCDKPTETYTPGMSQKGSSGALTFVLVQVNGDAPAVGIDTWTIKLLDANGQPVEGATFPTLKAWMPEHNHGWTAAMAAAAGGGTYDISNLYLFMAGFWQITIEAQAGSVTDTTVFSFCLGDSS